MAASASNFNRAQTTNYQNNDLFNPLAHALVDNIDNPNIQAPAQERLRAAFVEAHGVHPTWNELKIALKNLDPIQREVVLGPVLRIMAATGAGANARLYPKAADPADWQAIGQEDLLRVANELNIYVELYDSKFALQALKKRLEDDEKLIREDRIRTQLRYPLRPNPLNLAQAASLNAAFEREKIDINKAVEAKIVPIMSNKAHMHHPERNLLAGRNAAGLTLPADRTASLKIWANDGKECSFEKPNAAEHNQKYASFQSYVYDRDKDAIKAVVAKSFTSGNPLSLGTALKDYSNKANKDNPERFLDGMKKGMSSLAKMFGGGPFVTLIFEVFSNLFATMSSLFPALQGLEKMFSGVGKADTDLPDEKELKELIAKHPDNPEFAARAEEFSGYAQMLADTGPSGKGAATQLTKEWKEAIRDPNDLPAADPGSTFAKTEIVFEKLLAQMKANGLEDEASALLDAQTNRLLQQLKQAEVQIEAKADAIAAAGNDAAILVVDTPIADAANVSDGAALKTALDEIEAQLVKALEDKDAENFAGFTGYAGAYNKEENYNNRLTLYRELMKLRPVVEDKKKLDVALDLEQQQVNLSRQHHIAPAAVQPTLAESLRKVTEELARLEPKATEYVNYKQNMEATVITPLSNAAGNRTVNGTAFQPMRQAAADAKAAIDAHRRTL